MASRELPPPGVKFTAAAGMDTGADAYDSDGIVKLDPVGMDDEGEEDAHGEKVEDTAKDDHWPSSKGAKCQSSGNEAQSPVKKTRTTLRWGQACVPCRNRKLKCSGERPCAKCSWAQVKCHYQEIARRKPRQVLLEERVVELEQRLWEVEGTPSSSKLSSRSNSTIIAPSAPTLGSLNIKIDNDVVTRGGLSISPLPHAFLHPDPSSQITLQVPNIPASMAFISGGPDVPPCSPLESALVNFVLPYTPYLLMPLHAQRFLGSIALPQSDTRRPHPALMYILFAEAARILEAKLPVPKPPPLPRSLFPSHVTIPPKPMSPADHAYMLAHVRGMSTALLERARTELDNGIRSVDRPFDLARAAVGIARYLYSLGRFMEGWHIPVLRLFVSCGLHRNIATANRPLHVPDISTSRSTHEQAYRYVQANSVNPALVAAADVVPTLRRRPVILPPARDEIDVAERVMAFWAAKAQDWEAGIARGWSLSLADEECTTQWPWGPGTVEARSLNPSRPSYNLADLHDMRSSMHTSGVLDTTYVLALKSLALLHRASHLSDHPISAVPTVQSPHPTHILPLSVVQSIEVAILTFRRSLPLVLRDYDTNAQPAVIEPYDGHSDPWWIMLHMNLYAAEMLTYIELAHHTRAKYHNAVSSARSIVKVVRHIVGSQWFHVGMVVVLDVSLAARFLNKEAQRLATLGHPQASKIASDEAELLRVALARNARYLPMSGSHDLVIQRTREGWNERDGEHERE